MSGMQQSFNAGQTKGNTQAKVEQWTDSIQDTADAACRDRTSPGAQSTWDSARMEKDQSAGFLQQTGEASEACGSGCNGLCEEHTWNRSKSEMKE